MAQFDIHRFSDTILVIDLQNGFLNSMATRLVAPVYPVGNEALLIKRLNPVIMVEERRCFIAMQEAAAVRASALGEPVGNAGDARDSIVAALDLLVTGV